MKWKPDIKQIMTGTEHKTIHDAIAADIVSAIPVLGPVSDFFRLIDADTRPRKALQSLDFATSALPMSDLFTPTNTLIFLDKRNMLPIPLETIDKLFKKFSAKRNP